MLVILIVGVWALVFKPSGISAHHSGSTAYCDISGFAFGGANDGDVEVYDFWGVSVDCTIY